LSAVVEEVVQKNFVHQPLAIEAFNDLLKKRGKKPTVENPLAD
jgi:hypothetical protein